MFSMKKNKLLVSINVYIQEMHVIFNDIKVYRKEIWEIEHREVQDKFELEFEIDFPVNETQFSKTTINNTFFV